MGIWSNTDSPSYRCFIVHAPRRISSKSRGLTHVLPRSCLSTSPPQTWGLGCNNSSTTRDGCEIPSNWRQPLSRSACRPSVRLKRCRRSVSDIHRSLPWSSTSFRSRPNRFLENASLACHGGQLLKWLVNKRKFLVWVDWKNLHLLSPNR